MTTPKYLCSGKAIKETVLQSKYFMILHLIVLFLASAFSSITIYNDLASSMEEIKYRSWGAIEEYLSMSGAAGMLISTAVGIITAYLMFSFLFNKNSVIFYHSMPYKRSNLFLSRYISGIITIAIPLLAQFVINTIIYIFFKSQPSVASGELFSYETLVNGFLLAFLQYVVVFSVGAFSASVSGNIFAMAGISAFVFLVTPVTAAILEACIDEWFITYNLNLVYNPFKLFPPSMCLEYLRGNIHTGDIVYALVFALVFALAGLVLYIYRKSENSNKFFAYSIIGKVLKYYITVVITLGFGIVFRAASRGNIIITYVGYILVSFIVFAVVQAVFEMNFKYMFKNIKSYAVFAVIFLAILSVPMLDVFGIDASMPDRADIEKIEISKFVTANRGDWYSNNYITLEEEKNIDAVYDFLKKSVPYALETEKAKTYPQDSGHMNIRINDGGFLKVERHLRYTKEEDRDELLQVLYESDEYREQLTVDVVDLRWMTISKGNITTHQSAMKKDDQDKIIEAIKKDIMSTSYEDVKNSYKYAHIFLDYASVDKAHFYKSEQVPVMSCYEETVKVIDDVLDLDMHIDATVKAVISGYNKVVTDKEQIEELIRRGISSGEEVKLYYDEFGYTSVFIPQEHIPDFVK